MKEVESVDIAEIDSLDISERVDEFGVLTFIDD